MATVSSNTNLTAVSYSAGEIIDITSGATLTIDSTPATRPGTIQCITSGKLRIENASTTTPIVLTLNTNTNDLRFEKNGIFEARGAMIELGTGNGTSGQAAVMQGLNSMAQAQTAPKRVVRDNQGRAVGVETVQ